VGLTPVPRVQWLAREKLEDTIQNRAFTHDFGGELQLSRAEKQIALDSIPRRKKLQTYVTKRSFLHLFPNISTYMYI
jgi:hypothetical protein